jgi:hypothetical protein
MPRKPQAHPSCPCVRWSHPELWRSACLLVTDYVFYNANKTINKPFKAILAVLTGDPACSSK